MNLLELRKVAKFATFFLTDLGPVNIWWLWPQHLPIQSVKKLVV
jgi:hypothetical protein